MRSARESRSTEADTSSRSTRRAVSSAFAWSAASAASNSVWSIGKSGGALGSAAVAVSRRRRYSSRAAVWSSGKPSKPSAWAKRTTVELEVLARRASSSAVWNATSSRWSTMYWPTSFWERENSSNRWRISSDRVRAAVPERVTLPNFAGCGGVPARSGLLWPPDGPPRPCTRRHRRVGDRRVARQRGDHLLSDRARLHDLPVEHRRPGREGASSRPERSPGGGSPRRPPHLVSQPERPESDLRQARAPSA